MENGRAEFVAPLTADHALVLERIFICRAALRASTQVRTSAFWFGQGWPGQDAGAWQEVLMVTDGVDGYQNGTIRRRPICCSSHQ